MRDEFQGEIDALIDVLLRTGDTVIDMLDRALTALVEEDLELAAEVVRADDRVDATYADVQERVVKLMALQAPVASDLRLIATMLRVDIHLERMGDYAVNVARAVRRTSEYRDDPDLARQLREMGDLATEVARSALRAFGQRDVELARRLDDIDDGVDRLNIGVFQRLVRLAATDEERLRWATHMVLVARQIERFGDHAVDIGEATIFAVTGEVVELSSNEPEGDEAALG